jgi:hypothetical protein
MAISSTALVKALAPKKSSGAIVIRQSAPAQKKHKAKSKGHHKGASLQTRMMAHATGGFILGIIDKNFPTLPTLPFLGRAGTIAAIAYFLAGKHKIAQDVATSGASVAGYEMGKEGKISGVGHRGVGETMSTV